MRDDLAAPLLESIDHDEKFATWHLVLRDGTIVGYGRGGVVLLRTMQCTRAVARPVAWVPDAVLDVAYSVVARNRSKLGRLVPDRPGPHRFP
jgi:predicted DCC family thiol-disulfide oxidoreductase YuxK